jgi:uncharacterized membrane protein
MKTIDTLKETLKKEWLAFILLAYPFLFILLAWEKLPAQIPVHWNFEGEVDSFINKEYQIFFLPLFNVGIWLLLFFLPRIDPRYRHYLQNPKAFRTIRLAIVFILSLLNCTSFCIAIGYNINMVTAVYYSILLVFLVLGNSIVNIRSNYFIGIRTPWTLSNEDVWRKTHRFAGKLWIGLALFFIGAGLLLPLTSSFLLLFFIALAVFIPVGYSYALYRQQNNR